MPADPLANLVEQIKNVPDFGDMTEDVARELHALRIERLEREASVVGARQRYLAREHGEAQMHADGALVGQIDEAVYQHYVDRYGAAWWHDKGNRAWFFKRHPEAKVKVIAPAGVRVSQLPAYRVSDRRSSAQLVTA
jgi:hypothetical protein